MLLEQEDYKFSRSSGDFAPEDKNKLCAHDESKKHAELWIRPNLFIAFLMYALHSAHKKVSSYELLFGKPGRSTQIH